MTTKNYIDKKNRRNVKWKDSPGYKLTKYITTQLEYRLQLPNTYNIQNSITLIYNLKNIERNENTRLCSLDIKSMYNNIPVTKVRNIIEENLENDNHTPENEIMNY
jgi:hypothetical protein